MDWDRAHLRSLLTLTLSLTLLSVSAQRIRLLDAYLPERVDPLISDRWHQEADPYLRFTPLDSLGNHCVVGCVALALGEVMRYHEWPADVYDWKNMLDEYIPGQFSTKEGDAVGWLLADCGQVVNMKYGSKASSAEIVSQPIALVDSFGYDIATQLHFRDFYRQNEWHDMWRRELAAGRPILLCAQSASLSHAFVCDGYNERGEFHILWGNPTKDEDGWYDITKLTPDQPKWYDKDNPERGLNLIQSICTGVQPPQQGSHENHVFGMSHIEAWKDEGIRNIAVVTHNLANIGRNLHNGRVALALTYKGEIVNILAEYGHNFELEELNDTSYTDTLHINVVSPIKTLGEYHIVPVFEDNGEWVEVRTSVGTPNYVYVELTSDDLEIREIHSSVNSLAILDLQFPDTLVHTQAPMYSITLQNQSKEEYCGRIYFALVDPARPDENLVFSAQGLYLSAGEATTRSFYQTPLYVTGPGNYSLRIFADMDLFTDSIVTLKNFTERDVAVVSTDIDSSRAHDFSIFNSQLDEGAHFSSATYDLFGRPVYAIRPNQIVISPDGKKRLSSQSGL
ncbi:MAG: C10 family peptidase [Bacteroidaceae bacterium]|nr:C10 family peptidase [Bacteroidaceae bacterium]